MLLISSPIPLPSILITPASPEKNHPDPYSPFPSPRPDIEAGGYRADRLSLPLSAHWSSWHSSPLRPADRSSHKGLSPDQFNSLLRLSRDQRAKLGSQKASDLRKELAFKNQGLKQLERRARFLSKINEPSCIVTLSIPEAPQESPATVHPSHSPCRSEYRVSGIWADDPEHSVVVNSLVNPGVECDLITELPLGSSKSSAAMPNKSRYVPPSLDEITARLKPVNASSKKHCARSRLPSFLQASRSSTDDQTKSFTVRSLTLNDGMFDTAFAQQVIRSQHPDSCNLTLGSRRAIMFRSVDVAVGPALHTSRVDTARDMILTLGRRGSPPPSLGRHECAQTGIAVKRWSAPAELEQTRRVEGQVGF